MRHRKAGVKLGRNSSHRKAMFRNMVTSLFKYERIRTTDVKAKALRALADHVVTLAKRGDLHARRQAMAIIRENDVVHRLFDSAVEKFGSINGGYTRIVKVGRRPGDAAPVSIIELVTAGAPLKKKKPEPKKTVEKEAASITPAAGTPVEAPKETEAVADAAGSETPVSVEPKVETEAVADSEGQDAAEPPAADEAEAAGEQKKEND